MTTSKSAQFWGAYPKLDYVSVIAERAETLRRIRANPRDLPALRQYYRTHPADFISDWCVTVDTREIAKGGPALVPFVPWPKQFELIEWMYQRWRSGDPGTIVKSRDVGASYCAMAVLCTLCIFERNFAAGIVSATEVKLDRVGDPDTLLYKARLFLKHLPPEFSGGYVEDKHSSYLRIVLPETGSTIVGETGDQAGRGGRKAIVMVDESAHLPHPKVTDAALAATTPCRIDLSSVNGIANSFYERAHNPDIPRFDITWRDDLRKSLAWYEELRRRTDPVIVAQEYDCDFSASTEGQLIPTHLINSAIGAAQKLGIEVSGAKHAGFDVADEGRDKCAVALRHGIELNHLEAWNGKGSNVFKSTQRALGICDARGVRSLAADADGLGSSVRGDAEVINENRLAAGKPEIEVTPFRGSGAVVDAEGSMVEGRTNRDHFANAKAQWWWHLRTRFELTHRAVEAVARGERPQFEADDLISISPALPHVNALVAELSQVRWVMTAAGKVLIDKQPDGVPSPNLADAAMICFSQRGDAYFSGVRTVAAPSSERAAPEFPARLDNVFGSLVVVDDVAAIVYCASNRPDGDGSRGVALWVLDYDLRVLAEGADAWLLSLDEHLAGVRDSTPPAKDYARLAGTYLDDLEQGWANALDQLGVTTNIVGDDLPPLIERFNKCRPYVARGLVALGPVAVRKEVGFRGARRNFLREVVTASAAPESSVLAMAFATAVLLVYHGRASVPTPTLNPEQFPRPEAPPPPSLPERITEPGVSLKPGLHKIDGLPVTVLRDGDKDLVFLPLSEGKHVIDDVQEWVRRPGGGTFIPVEDLWMYQ